MDKRTFLAGSAGAAVTLTGSAGAANGTERLTQAALRDLRASGIDQRSLSVIAQVELIQQAVATPEDRAAFIAAPLAYAHARGIDIDIEFARVMRDELRTVEAKAVAVIDRARIGDPTTLSDSRPPQAAPVVVAAVNAVAAVVNAVATTYIAFKWKNPF